MYKLKISSSLKPYCLEFTNNYSTDLKKLYSKGDLILIDSIIFLTYGLPKFINKLVAYNISRDLDIEEDEVLMKKGRSLGIKTQFLSS